MKAEDFEKQLGPFVLVQRPPDEMTQQRAIQLGAKRTIALNRNATKDPMSLLLELEDLLITTLPPLDSHENLSVGRLPDCDVVVDDPSVSKHHATLSWDETLQQALVNDLESSNGTSVNGIPPNAQRTSMARPEVVSTGALSLLFQFDDLMVATVPPMQDVDELSVGRSPDNDLVIDDASASKRHAMLRWDDANKRCTIQDLQSTNGTFLNASVRLRRETTLKNGDILSFGEVQYWFLLTDTLYVKLRGGDSRARL